MKKGKAYLVGAGPGDPGLLTLRAAGLISRCDVLIYDNLVNMGIVDTLAHGHCERIYVGKSGASHTMEQEDINRLIVEKARSGGMVVRLKGGDPYIFGRGGEEALFCAQNGIEFEVVNGISSAYAVPAYAGIPVTNRGYSSSVAFITGHEDPTKLESDINWEKLATGVQTLVFLMGVKNLPLIAQKLVQNGLDPATPAAVIQNGCQPSQRVVSGTVSDIAEKVRQAGIRPPSITIFGSVVSLREQINWYESRPLFGKTVLVTRSREQASELTAKLSDLGAAVIETPVIRIEPVEDQSEIRRCIGAHGTYDWIIFTSVNGVVHFFRVLTGQGLDARALARARVCAIGPATADSLRAHGIHPDLVPEKFISTDIVASLVSRNEVAGKSFFLPRADIAPRELADQLRERGATLVDDIAVYRTVEEDFDAIPGVEDILRGRAIDLVTFTSSSTARNFHRLLTRAGISDMAGYTCAAIGPITARTASELGFTVSISAGEHTIQGLVDAILAHYRG
jgi:uroporphyrinogen III methyltransferase / synthase